ncbi:MAG: glycoside hydrolase family 38 C-terminal domain-containing protein, partial [Cyanobacteria bacterium J06642_11]
RPDLFARIQQQVVAGKWSIDAGLWVEPELNIVGGEAIARQILYGQHYCQEKFGARSVIAWLPDTFGFCSQLPQLLQLGGVQVFATQKLRWNDTTQFPHELFRWQAPDGSEVLGWTLPPIGTDFDPVQMAQYSAQWEEKTGSSHTCWLPGVGDHGGGPTRDMLMKARRWQQSPLFPQVKFSTPTEFLQQAVGTQQLLGENEDSVGLRQPTAIPTFEALPLWSDELYLELHRGCYTSHSDQKQQNRRTEDLLYQAEVWSTVAHRLTGQPYPKETLETAWKGLLFNQFHDILPGSSIPEVFQDANQAWAEVISLGRGVLETALETVATQVSGTSAQGKPLLVFNCHSWPRTQVVELEIPPGQWKILDGETHQLVESVHSSSSSDNAMLNFVACDVPAVGYRLYVLVQDDEKRMEPVNVPDEFVLENDLLRVCVSAETGEIVSFVHQATGQEVFRAPANQLQCFEDAGQYWDAWNIAPDYHTKPASVATLQSIEWISHSSICQQLRVTRQLNHSTIIQDYSLAAQSPLLRIETWVDWQETQVVLKVNFPTEVRSDQATYEVPFGAIQRSTKPVTDHEKAKWEVPALRWADLSDETFGVSILTDCKHGFDAKPDQLRLTLLKAPLWPDPGCDRGQHHFTYAIYPHVGNWQTAQTPHHAQELNIPLRVHVPQETNSPDASASRSFFQIDADNLLLAALKPSEMKPDTFIARYYDAYGVVTASSRQTLVNSLGLIPDTPLNLLEEPQATGPDRPYQIHTRLLKLLS